MQITVRVCFAVIPSTGEAFRDLGTFVFVSLQLFSVGRCHLSTAVELPRLIKILEELHTKVQGVI